MTNENWKRGQKDKQRSLCLNPSDWRQLHSWHFDDWYSSFNVGIRPNVPLSPSLPYTPSTTTWNNPCIFSYFFCSFKENNIFCLLVSIKNTNDCMAPPPIFFSFYIWQVVCPIHTNQKPHTTWLVLFSLPQPDSHTLAFKKCSWGSFGRYDLPSRNKRKGLPQNRVHFLRNVKKKTLVDR